MKLSGSSFKTQYGQYSFATDGGAQGAISLGVFLPATSVIRSFSVVTRTAPVGVGATISFGFSGSVQALMVTTGITAFVIATAMIGVDLNASPLPLAAFSEVIMTIATANLTAGIINFEIGYDEYQS